MSEHEGVLELRLAEGEEVAGAVTAALLSLGWPTGYVRASGRYEMKAGDRFLLQSAGGGGYGDPHQRDEANLRADVAEGYVTRAAAKSVYGKEI